MSEIPTLPPWWRAVRWFRPEEFGPWAPVMSPVLLPVLDGLRQSIGVPMHILSSGRTREEALNPHSEHIPHPLTGLVNAVDTRPETAPSDLPLAVWKLYVLAEHLQVPGVGVYHWSEGRPRPFIHLDVGDGMRDARPSRWIRDRDGRYINITQNPDRHETVREFLGIPIKNANVIACAELDGVGRVNAFASLFMGSLAALLLGFLADGGSGSED